MSKNRTFVLPALLDQQPLRTSTPSLFIRREFIPWVVCGVLAALSLMWTRTPTYDPWSWLVWSRELAGQSPHLFDLAGASGWKPLPVLFQLPFDLLGLKQTPEIWLWICRTSILMIPVAGWKIGFAAGERSGAIAGGLAGLLSPGLLVYLGGLSEPVAALCLLLLVERSVKGHPLQAWLIGMLAVLGRPEMLGGVLLGGVWLCYREKLKVRWIILGVSGSALLWMAGDWIASGKPLAVAGKAAVSQEPRLVQESHWPGLYLLQHQPLEGWTGWAFLAAALLSGIAAWIWKEQGGQLLALVALGCGGGLILATQLGYPGVPRYLAPVIPVMAILAAGGIARLARLITPRTHAQSAAAGLGVAMLLLPAAASQAKQDISWYNNKVQNTRELETLVQKMGGTGAVKGCWGAVVHPADLTSALAYYLQIPLRRTGRSFPRGISIKRAPQLLVIKDQSDSQTIAQAGEKNVSLRPLGRWHKWSIWSTRSPSGKTCGPKENNLKNP